MGIPRGPGEGGHRVGTGVGTGMGRVSPRHTWKSHSHDSQPSSRGENRATGSGPSHTPAGARMPAGPGGCRLGPPPTPGRPGACAPGVPGHQHAHCLRPLLHPQTRACTQRLAGVVPGAEHRIASDGADAPPPTPTPAQVLESQGCTRGWPSPNRKSGPGHGALIVHAPEGRRFSPQPGQV